jgi:hypothetical protein
MYANLELCASESARTLRRRKARKTSNPSIMKTLPILFCLFLFQSAFAQHATPGPGSNPYLKYQHRTFECGFRSTDKTILALHRATGKDTRSNFLTSSFGKDSTYLVVLTISEVIDSKLRERECVFKGKYTIDEKGNIWLSDKHPFSSDRIRIKDKRYRNFNYTLRYKFRLNSEFKKINGRKLFAYCDGSCEFPREE